MQNISPIKQRILQYVDTLGISKREFYLKTGISRGTLESLTGITEETVAKFIVFCPEISPDWLLTGQGSMLRTGVPAGPVEGCLPGEAGVSPPVCERCRDKDAVIAAQKAQIDVQIDYIELLKEQCPPGSGQKRKRECA